MPEKKPPAKWNYSVKSSYHPAKKVIFSTKVYRFFSELCQTFLKPKLGKSNLHSTIPLTPCFSIGHFESKLNAYLSTFPFPFCNVI